MVRQVCIHDNHKLAPCVLEPKFVSGPCHRKRRKGGRRNSEYKQLLMCLQQRATPCAMLYLCFSTSTVSDTVSVLHFGMLRLCFGHAW